MHIIISDATLSHGGAERVISIIANEMSSKGHTVELLLYYDMPIWYELDEKVKVTIDERAIGKTNALRHMMYRRAYIRETKPDIVISFLAPFNMLMILTMLGLNIPLLVADRNDPHRVPTNWVYRVMRNFLYRFADGIILQSVANQQYFSYAVQKKSCVIYNPVNIGSYQGSALRALKKKKIVSVGRLIEQKNPFLLLDAFREVVKTHRGYTLIHYGDGDLREALVKRTEEYGIADIVSYPGPVKNVFDCIKDAEIFVMTSDYEGMPNALLEAMCLGLPVISTRVAGAVDVIQNGENGLLVECGNKKQLVEAMLRFINDKNFAESCANKGAGLIKTLDKKEIVKCWADFIERIINNNDICRVL